MKSVYINAAQCISAQNTLVEDFSLDSLTAENNHFFLDAIAPNYKEFIPPAMIRRMSKTVKMSMVTSQKALQEADVKNPDAIIVGTGMGCEEDSEKFLKNVIENNEEFLTPTYFIQSTHNTVAGQIALGLGCHAYNFTYVNSGSSLEMSLLDAKLQIQDDEANNVLVGATDEKASRTMELYQLNGTIKKEAELHVDYLSSETDGVVWGEGSAFFVVSNQKQNSTFAELQDVTLINELKRQELNPFINDFLNRNQLKISDIDVVILGFSGDKKSDVYYHEALKSFENAQQLYFKHLSGEFNTSSGFGFFMANQILKQQHIPEIMKINSAEKASIKNLLIYNNLGGKDHSFTLLKSV